MEIKDQFRETLHDNKQATHDIFGSIRINPRNYTDAFINDPNGGVDIYIEGFSSRSTALDGDLVKVRLNHPSKWKLNCNLIANKWEVWSPQLIPILEQIERSEQAVKLLLEPSANLDQGEETTVDDVPVPNPNGEIIDNLDPTSITKKSSRTKRSVQNEQTNNAGANVSKLPTNLPPGISKLKIEHIKDLPFFLQCVQKTGVVIEVVKSNHPGLAGGFLRKHSSHFALFSPTDSRVPRMLVPINECPLDFATQSDRYKDILFVAQMVRWDSNRIHAIGSLVKIVGDCHDVRSRIEAMLIENQIHDSDFPQDVYDELDFLNHLPSDWILLKNQNRRDLTNECVFTIDPKTARDLDDAVSIRQVAEQIYEVGVHIADVSYFVKEMSAVDYHARLRTTSVYLVDRVIPMLPRILCEQMCSLNAGESKFTFSVIWKLDKYGRVIDQWFGRTIIKSCVKLSYEQAQDMIDRPGDISWIQEGTNMPKLHAFDWKHISKSVVLLNKIAQNLRTKRFKDGALRIEQVKLKYELDPESGFPTGVMLESRSPANYLIEEYMLLANMAVAKLIYSHCPQLAFLRRHPPSSSLLLKEVKEFCEAKGYPLDITNSASLQRSLNSISDPITSKVVSFLLLRAMKNAEYVCSGSVPNDGYGFGHFALNVPFYTHFTSPIRRYADVIVHRMLEIALDYNNTSNEDLKSLSLMADECTKRKISSKLISDTSQKLYFNLFVQKAGFCELLACVTRINDQSFDVILVDYDRTGRVYLENLKPHLINSKFESFSGIKRLVLNWKPSMTISKSKKSKKKNKSKPGQADDLNSRSYLESNKIFPIDAEMYINEPKNDKQIIEVFDIIRVIVTTNPKDITQLKVELKIPTQ